MLGWMVERLIGGWDLVVRAWRLRVSRRRRFRALVWRWWGFGCCGAVGGGGGFGGLRSWLDWNGSGRIRRRSEQGVGNLVGRGFDVDGYIWIYRVHLLLHLPYVELSTERKSISKFAAYSNPHACSIHRS